MTFLIVYLSFFISKMFSFFISQINSVNASDYVHNVYYSVNESRWIANFTEGFDGANVIFYSCQIPQVCEHYHRIVEDYQQPNLLFAQVENDISFNNLSFTLQGNTYSFFKIWEYQHIRDIINYFFFDTVLEYDPEIIDKTIFITIICDKSHYSEMKQLSKSLYNEYGLIDVLVNEKSEISELWNPYESRSYEFNCTEENFRAIMERKFKTATIAELIKNNQMALVCTDPIPTARNMEILQEIFETFPDIIVMKSNPQILRDINYLTTNIDTSFVLLYPSLSIFSTIQRKEINRSLIMAERSIKNEIHSLRMEYNDTRVTPTPTPKPEKKLDCSGKMVYSVPIQVYYGPKISELQYSRVLCYIKQNIENKDNFTRFFNTVIGSNSSNFNLIIPRNVSSDHDQDQFWENFKTIEYNLTDNSLPWNVFGPGMPHYRELNFDHSGNAINHSLNFNSVDTYDEYFHGGADRAHIDDFTNSIQKHLKSKRDFKPLERFERSIFDWLYSARNTTKWFALSTPSNPGQYLTDQAPFEYLNTGTFNSFYSANHDKCILFYDNSPYSEDMLSEFNKIARIARENNRYNDLKFGTINVDFNYAQYMPRNISAPLVMKSKIPFIAVLPQQWYIFQPFIVDDPKDVEDVLARYIGLERFNLPTDPVPRLFRDDLWADNFTNILNSKLLRGMAKKNYTSISPSGKKYIPNEMFYWSLQFYRQKY